MTDKTVGATSERSLMVGLRLTLEHRAVETAAELAAVGIPSILLKGPSFIRWLYGQGETRTSADVDVLVPPQQWDAAEEVLRRGGFSSSLEGLDDIAQDRKMWSCEWVRAADGAIVDLHRSLVGVRCLPHKVWEVLSRNSEEMPAAGSSVRTLNLAARAFHVASHHAQHPGEQTSEDLRRALHLEDLPTWRAAADIARDLEALDWFASGLRLLPEGREVATALDLPEQVSIETYLLSTHSSSASLFLNQLKNLPTLKARIHLLAGKLVPPRSFMRSWIPIASHGPVGLVAAYVLRPFILSVKVPRGIIDWYKASRSARSS